MDSSGQVAHARQKLSFLKHLAKTGNVSAAVRKAGIGRSTAYLWRDEDPEFCSGWAEAEIVATESLEREAWRRAVKGLRKEYPAYYKGEEVGVRVETEYSDTLLIFLLKSRAPEKYRERYDVTTHGQPIVKAYSAEDLALL